MTFYDVMLHNLDDLLKIPNSANDKRVKQDAVTRNLMAINSKIFSRSDTKMPQLSEMDRARVIGMIQSGLGVKEVVRQMQVTPKTIRKLREKYQNTNSVKTATGTGMHKSTGANEYQQIVNFALDNRTDKCNDNSAACLARSR